MSIEVKVPILPESVADATMLSWHKRPGDQVRRDENLVDIETEKVVLEVPSPQDGVLKQVVKAEGETVLAQEVIAVIEPLTQDAQSDQAAEPDTGEGISEMPETPAKSNGGDGSSASLSPAVRRMVSEHDINASQIEGTGKGGRILKEDVQKHLEQRPSAEAPPLPSAAVPSPITGDRAEHREPMSRLRATIANRLVQAQQTAALLTTFNEVDLQAVMDLRRKYKESFEQRHGTRLGFMSFFVKASVEALTRFPLVNAYIDGNDIVYHDYYDIGIAVASPRGLVVPIIRNADQNTFAGIESVISSFGEKARDGRLTMEELSGGTFTITNGGIFGSLVSTPIINPPQSAILGMHKIQQRPVAENGEVKIKPMMYLALSYDHRIIDGREAVQFLVTIKEALEDPTRLLLQV
ncbi:MAG: 2-oxoglutarate dehydrogenase complex dihydrolipoyllysine-residue succinyltransferase [Gammaproteobacteria bacterium]|nr:2-oxoglutarate dehydrogenase complex dihydrolipoyllysine-residue succinyltransferase [Gammaproteobacteria bacterium]